MLSEEVTVPYPDEVARPRFHRCTVRKVSGSCYPLNCALGILRKFAVPGPVNVTVADALSVRRVHCCEDWAIEKLPGAVPLRSTTQKVSAPLLLTEYTVLVVMLEPHAWSDILAILLEDPCTPADMMVAPGATERAHPSLEGYLRTHPLQSRHFPGPGAALYHDSQGSRCRAISTRARRERRREPKPKAGRPCAASGLCPKAGRPCAASGLCNRFAATGSLSFVIQPPREERPCSFPLNVLK